MSSDEGIVVVGACNIDLISYIDRIPFLGETLKGSRFEQGFGGKGANQCVQFAKLAQQRKKVSLISQLGDDVYGRETLEHLREEGVNVDHVGISKGVSSGVAPIFVTPKGENCIVICGGANDVLDPDRVRSALCSLKDGIRWVTAQLEVPMAVTIAVAQEAQRLGLPLLLNTAPAPSCDRERLQLLEEVLPLCTVVCPNEVELAQLAGVEPFVEEKEQDKQDKDKEDPALHALLQHVHQCCTLLRKKIDTSLLKKPGKQPVILVTLGSRGAFLDDPTAVSDESSCHIPPAVRLPPSSVIDTTGAGDSFFGALSYFMCGCPLREAVTLANQVASMSVKKRGTQSSYANYTEWSNAFGNK